MIVQQGDVSLFQTVDGGEISLTNGLICMTGGFETAAYLSLFGGNVEDNGLGDNSFTWWGNLSETEPQLQYRSETQNLLESIPAVSGNLRRIEDAVNRDLNWFLEADIASSIDVSVSMPDVNRINIQIAINAVGEESSFEFTENWKSSI